jgi:hypothetical protein
VRLFAEMGRAEDAVRAADEAVGRKGISDDPTGVAEIALALDLVDADHAAAIADRALAMLAANRDAERENAGDEWDHFLRGAQRSRDAEAYNALARLRAAHTRYSEAAELMQMSLDRTPDYYRPDLRPGRAALVAEYRQKAAAQTRPDAAP